MNRTLSIIFILLTAATGSVWAKDIRATTEDGRAVLLKSDGSWRYASGSKSSPPGTSGYKKPTKAMSVYKAKGDKVQLWYDPQKWRLEQPEAQKKVTFGHKDGDVYGMVIAERIQVSPETLRDIAIKNATAAAPNARIILEENRTVNGRQILCMIMEGTIEGINFVYYSYYYAGSAGTVQLITYTSQNLFREYKEEMAEFLNGLTIME